MTLSREIPANAVPGVLRVKPARTRLLSALTQGDALNIVPGLGEEAGAGGAATETEGTNAECWVEVGCTESWCW